MRTLIAFATKYGGTKVCAERVAERIPGETTLLPLTKSTKVDLSGYDTVVIGTPVYLGKPKKEVVLFCQQYEKALLTKKLGLFLSCIQDDEKVVADQLSQAFPKGLLGHAAAAGVLGGIVDYKKLGKIDGLIMNVVAGKLRKQNPMERVDTLSDMRFDNFVKTLLR